MRVWIDVGNGFEAAVNEEGTIVRIRMRLDTSASVTIGSDGAKEMLDMLSKHKDKAATVEFSRSNDDTARFVVPVASLISALGLLDSGKPL